MNTYLLTWNPQKWPWNDLAEFVFRIEQGEEVDDKWTFVRKAAQVDDRVFMLKQGREPRGLMGSGRVTGEVKWGLHYDKVKAEQGIWRRYLPIVFESLLAPNSENILPLATLQREIKGAPANFEPQGSGSLVAPKAARQLEKLWQAHLSGKVNDREKEAFEGEARGYFILHRSREGSLREAKIEQVRERDNGVLSCEVPGCGFNFAAVYGEVGEGYAQVHHLRPLAEAERVTALTDLIVVCANCHAMIHRSGECRDTQSLIKESP